MEDEKNQLPEAPLSTTVRGFYKGYSVLLTMRDPEIDGKPLLQKSMSAIDWMEQNDFKPDWRETEPTTQPSQPPLPMATATAPKVHYKDPQSVDQATCPHEHVTQKQSIGKSRPENKGRWYEQCATCNKFLKWV